MVRSNDHHRVDIIRDSVYTILAFGSTIVIPSRKSLRVIVYCLLAIARDALAIRRELRRAIRIQHVSTNTEQLKDLTRVILVRALPRAARHVEIVSHGGAQGD